MKQKGGETVDDSKIIELFFERSEQAIIELSEKYGTKCKFLARSILRDERDSEECVSDAYLGIWEKIPPERPEHLLSYLLRVVRNQAIKRYHSNTAQKRNSHYDLALEELEGCFAVSQSVEDEIFSEEISREIDCFLGGLSQTDRVIFVKRYYFSMSIGEISKEFGIKDHAVSVKLFRLREKLKKHLLLKGVRI